MTVDLEDQLATLGELWRSTIAPVEFDDVVGRSQPVADRYRSPRRWLLAAAAVLVVITVGVGAWLVGGDRPSGVVTTIPTVPDSTAPDSTVPDSTAVVTTTSPQTGAIGGFSAPIEMPVWCGICTAVTLDDGRVLIAGGSGREGESLVMFDPNDDSFSVVALTDAGTVAVLPDDRVLLVDRLNPGQVSVFDPLTGALTDVANNLSGTPVVLGDGRVFIFGVDTVGQLDLAGGTLTTAPMPQNDQSSEPPPWALALPDGTVIVPLRGLDEAMRVYRFDPGAGTFTRTGWMNNAPSAVILADGRVLAGPEIWDPITGEATGSGAPIGIAAQLPDGRLLIVQSSTDSRTPALSQFYDIVTREVMSGPDLSYGHGNGSAVALADGRVLVFGSFGGNASGLPGPGPRMAEIFSADAPAEPVGGLSTIAVDAQLLSTDLVGGGATSGVANDVPTEIHLLVPAGVLGDDAVLEYSFTRAVTDGMFGSGGGDVLNVGRCSQGCTIVLPSLIEPGWQRIDLYAALTGTGLDRSRADEIEAAVVVSEG